MSVEIRVTRRTALLDVLLPDGLFLSLSCCLHFHESVPQIRLFGLSFLWSSKQAVFKPVKAHDLDVLVLLCLFDCLLISHET